MDQSSLGRKRVVNSKEIFEVKYKDGCNSPNAVLKFEYHSRSENIPCHQKKNSENTAEALQKNLLVPRTPSPVALKHRSVEQWTQEELREYARTQMVLHLPLCSIADADMLTCL